MFVGAHQLLIFCGKYLCYPLKHCSLGKTMISFNVVKVFDQRHTCCYFQFWLIIIFIQREQRLKLRSLGKAILSFYGGKVATLGVNSINSLCMFLHKYKYNYKYIMQREIMLFVWWGNLCIKATPVVNCPSYSCKP